MPLRVRDKTKLAGFGCETAGAHPLCGSLAELFGDALEVAPIDADHRDSLAATRRFDQPVHSSLPRRHFAAQCIERESCSNTSDKSRAYTNARTPIPLTS